MFKNYYQILGLEITATKEEIKKKYRLYATKFHPDMQNQDKFFEERFKEIKEAYDILMDDKKRAAHDESLRNDSKYSSNSHSQYSYKNYSSQSREKEQRKKEAEEKAAKERAEAKQKAERVKRNKIYYTSKDLMLNGLYVNYKGVNYYLDHFDIATIRKDDDSNFIAIGIIMIVIGVLTIGFFIGLFFLMVGIYGLFYKEYFIILIGKNREVQLLKGRKSKMKKIARRINKAIKERYG